MARLEGNFSFSTPVLGYEIDEYHYKSLTFQRLLKYKVFLLLDR